MKMEIKVKCISDTFDEMDAGHISQLLDTFDRQKLEYTPWPEFAGKADVNFSIAHNSSNIFLKYFVVEKHIRAENSVVNSPVHEDSCVEFFISFDEGINYYNIEFNCAGIGLIAYGSSKYSRQLLDENLVSNLKINSVIAPENGKSANWQLTLVIPLSTFVHTPVNKLRDLNCKANFYKCGDLLPEPHFISWSNIIADTPDFHLPKFFGNLVFE